MASIAAKNFSISAGFCTYALAPSCKHGLLFLLLAGGTENDDGRRLIHGQMPQFREDFMPVKLGEVKV
jgi:hypothetical protein